MDDLYVLEWSQKNGMVRVHSLEHTLKINRRAYMDNKSVPDYIPLAVGDLDTMTDAAAAMRPTLISRRPDKAPMLTL